MNELVARGSLRTLRLRPAGGRPPRRYSYLYRDSFINMMTRRSAAELLADESFLTSLRAIQVGCPNCDARSLKWCVSPRGRRLNLVHKARIDKAAALGYWTSRMTLTLPWKDAS